MTVIENALEVEVEAHPDVIVMANQAHTMMKLMLNMESIFYHLDFQFTKVHEIEVMTLTTKIFPTTTAIITMNLTAYAYIVSKSNFQCHINFV